MIIRARLWLNMGMENKLTKPQIEAKQASEMFGRDLQSKTKPKYEYYEPNEIPKIPSYDFKRDYPKGSEKWSDKEWDDFFGYVYPENGNEDYDPTSIQEFEELEIEPIAKRIWKTANDKYGESSDIYQVQPDDGDWYNLYRRAVDHYLAYF